MQTQIIVRCKINGLLTFLSLSDCLNKFYSKIDGSIFLTSSNRKRRKGESLFHLRSLKAFRSGVGVATFLSDQKALKQGRFFVDNKYKLH